VKKKELEDLGKDELIEECKSRGRLIKILLNEMEELDDKKILQYNSTSLGKPEIISPGRGFLAGKFQKEY